MTAGTINTDYSLSALKTLDIEMHALTTLKAALSQGALRKAVERAIHVLTSTQGKVIVTGMGKSGHIAGKIAATMRSTGTSALYLHPGEASHGDLGLIHPNDVVLAITWSGETAELLDIFHYCQKMQVPLIVATSHRDSTAGRAADICLTLPHVKEACPNELAPTSSTTLQLVLGDALAVALIEARGFSPADFRLFHPGGKLGAQLCSVRQIMGTGDAIPKVRTDASLTLATLEMSRKRYGCTAIVSDSDHLLGAFTDGDLRRCITTHDMEDNICLHMSHHPLTIAPDTLATDALRILNENAVSVLFVVENGRLIGIVHMHDIVRMGIV